MANEEDNNPEEGRGMHHVRLPRFVTDEDVGLGDVVKRVIYAAGIEPCSGCEQRAAILNRWLVFSGLPRKGTR
jgi:hypothetical protein